MLVLVINCGSSSVKYNVIQTSDETDVCQGVVERIGSDSSIIHHKPAGRDAKKSTKMIADHSEALQEILNFLLSSENATISDISDIEAVGHRVVHCGEMFKESVLIDDVVKDAIEQAFDLAPLHNPPNLKGIEAAQLRLPGIPHVAVFDTAFHHSLPPNAYLYGIPARLYRKHKIRKYGFHGTSHYYVSREYCKLMKKPVSKTNVITCHLGNGASITAIKEGKSVDTSMGFTPLSGMIMGTRSGDLDPSILFHIAEKEEMQLNSLYAMLNRQSGLLGISEHASDMRELIANAKKGDHLCGQAIDVFCYQIKKYVGSYMAVLNGCDAVIFTAGIGENSPLIRKKSLENMEHLGIEIDEKKNNGGTDGSTVKISTGSSKVDVLVIPTNEELVIAKDAERIVSSGDQSHRF